MRRTWSDGDLRAAVKDARSVAEALIVLGLKPCGGNYRTIKKSIYRLELDTSHFLGQGWRVNSTKPVKSAKSLDDILSGRVPYQSSDLLRRRLIKAGIKAYQCERCGLTEWLGRPIPLELEHVDGNSANNLISNLLVLCPNCHACTPTYRRTKKSLGSVA